jgi:hypothetical protein
MGDTVNLPISLDSDLGRKLVSDLARFSEGICSEQEVRKRHHFDESTWNALAAHEKLFEEVEAEKLRRIRNGAAKRELAQKHVVKAPNILDTIMCDPTASPRHRVDAIRTLDHFAANAGDARASETVYVIKFDLTAAPGGGEIETITKTLGPTKSSDELWPEQKIIEASPTKDDGDDNKPV